MGISSMHMPVYTPTLRHNSHSIAMYDDDFLHRCSDLDDVGMDSDASMASNNTNGNGHGHGHGHGNERIPKLKFNQSLPINLGKEKTRRKRQNGCKMLDEYKRSQLALNPNHTFC